jgi:DNA-binding beta-propeller fold protein YncE
VIVCQTVTPDGKFLYIGSVTNFTGSLVSIDLPGGTAAGPAVQSRNPEAIAITPNGSYAYVSNDDSVIVIDISPE